MRHIPYILLYTVCLQQYIECQETLTWFAMAPYMYLSSKKDQEKLTLVSFDIT